jgi:putative nucleotidyltransferase with HDIG domain
LKLRSIADARRRRAIVESLSARVDERDSYTAGHSRRVRRIALAIAIELGLDETERSAVAQAGLFHDIGKLSIPDEILLKPARLTEAEWELMRGHSDEGARMLEDLGLFGEALPAIRHHHERFDGSGYPAGLVGVAIPLTARIVHVADALDSMLTTRTYRAGRPPRDALAELRTNAGGQFCPDCVAALERVVVRGELEDMGLARRVLVASV